MGLLSLEGVPGASLPAAMASAHRTAVESAVASGRKAATRRELRQWAALTRMLIARCWTVQEALAAAWHQVRESQETETADCSGFHWIYHLSADE